ncbi:ankyrin repeat domain-containing protein 66-like [Xenia sp. Carnegie-2017]|uniref:ankyrin repeat domain-containing protein 66-like n=1 Tax=Xenia sp. Carnegie-2017 TaxID=2897299 RepID=UPI001F039D5B|nr:ankyrin repeat domain-containing protein 66-like [Xenia sp. Carnegie-2017]
MTELHEAAAKDDVKTLQCLLVKSDIDVDAEDWDWGKRTALHIAACNGSTATVKLLLDHGADMEMRMTGGWIPAHCAAEGGHVVVLRLLMEYKCPMNVQDDSGDTPVNIATVYGHKDVVMLLQKAIK